MAALGFAIAFTYLLIRNESEVHYDAWVYTQCAQSFEVNGLFNLRAFAADQVDSMRGYLFAWIIALGARLGQVVPWLDYRFLISLFTAAVLVCALPDMVMRLFTLKTLNPLRRLIPMGLSLLFFNGLYAYPLSDLWSAGFAILAVYALMNAADGGAVPLMRRLGMALLLGVSLGAAYNIRTIYLFLLMGAAVCLPVLLAFRKGITWAHKGWVCLLALAGFLLVSLPQILINSWNYGEATFLLVSKTGSDLFINQLYDGIYLFKYESNIGGDYWYDGMNYVDPVGQTILEDEGMAVTFQFGTGAEMLGNLSGYLALVLRHPLDFIGIYVRHAFSLLDHRYPNIFVTELYVSQLWPLANYMLLYLSIASVWIRVHAMPRPERLGLHWLLLLLVPTLAIIPGAIETRFGIVLFLLLWCCLACCVHRDDVKAFKPYAWVRLAIGGMVFVGCMCAIGGLIASTLLELPVVYGM